MMLIRPAAQADLPAVAAIQVTSWRVAYKGLLSDEYLGAPVERDLEAKWVGAEIPRDNICLVAEDGDIVVGFIYVLGDKSPAYIDNLHVDPTRKRSGIGAALMREAARALRDRGHDSTYLTVITDNHQAVSFYRKMGGEFGAAQDEFLYGEPVQSYPVHWHTLDALLG